jgi:hypothetical protein
MSATATRLDAVTVGGRHAIEWGGTVRYLTGTQMFNRLPALLKTEPGQYFAHLTLCSAIREAPRSAEWLKSIQN